MSAFAAAVSYDKDAIRAALPLRMVCEKEGMEFKSEGGNWKARCPFHAEKTGSFTIFGEENRGHCFGCGWDGDLFDFWAHLRGIDISKGNPVGFKEVVAQLAGLCGVGPRVAGVKFERTVKPARKPETLEENGRPWLPRMRRLTAGELEQLARLRGLTVQGLRHAERDERLGFAWWPVDGRGEQTPWSKGSWCITDPERWCAQFRPLDGSSYQGKDGDPFKSSSTKNTRWPIGAAQTGSRDSIVLLEGGADMLAAYQLLGEMGWLEEVAVWCVFGTAHICHEAMVHARGKRVRILADADPPQIKEYKNRPSLALRPGWEAAARWTEQLISGGAAEVSTYDLAPLLPEGGKDLNDLVRAPGGYGEVDLVDIFDF